MLSVLTVKMTEVCAFAKDQYLTLDAVLGNKKGCSSYAP